MITAYSDGSGKNCQGHGAASFLIVKNNIVIHQQTELLKDATNNVAEYTGLLNALKYCIAEGYDDITLYSDSELVVKQLNRQYETNNRTLRSIRDEILELINSLSIRVSIQWTPRTNIYIQSADRLNRLAVLRVTR